MVEAARRGELDVLWSSGGNFLDVLPAPDVTRTALRARAAARAPGHRADASDARRAGRDRRAAAGRDALRAGWRRHVDHHRAARRVQSRDPGPARRRGPQRVGDLRRGRAPGAARATPRCSGCESAADDPRRDRARRSRVRGHRDAARDRRPSRWAARVCARAACSRRPTARRGSASSRRRRATCPRAGSCSRPGAASSSTRWCGTTSIRSPARARDALFVAEADAVALGVREGDAVLVRSPHGEMRARVHIAPIRPGNVQAFFPEANPLLAPTCRDAASRASPTTTRSSRWCRSDDARRSCSSCSTTRPPRCATRFAASTAWHCATRTDRAGPVRARPRRRRRPRARCSSKAPVRIVSEESGVHERRGRRASRSCSIRSTARRTARVASRTGRRRSARSTPTARSRRWS